MTTSRRIITGIATSDRLNAHGDQHVVDGLSWRLPGMRLLLEHNSACVVGEVLNIWRDGSLLRFRAQVTDNAVWQRIEAGELPGASIRLQDTKADLLDDEAGRVTGRFVRSGDLVEISVCSAPANPDAVIAIEKRKPVQITQPQTRAAPTSAPKKRRRWTVVADKKSDRQRELAAAIERRHRMFENGGLTPDSRVDADVLAIALGAMDAQLKRLLGRIEAVEAKGISYAGVYQRAQSYQRGNVVTYEGSAWVALKAVEEGDQPGTGSTGWQLMVKSGKDAR